MLGPGIFFGSTPFALGYSLYARTRATNRTLTLIALTLAAFATALAGWGVVDMAITLLRAS